MLEGARVLQSHGAWGLAEAAAAHCVTLQAACRESAGRGRAEALLCEVSSSRYWRGQESFSVHSGLGALGARVKGGLWRY